MYVAWVSVGVELQELCTVSKYQYLSQCAFLNGSLITTPRGFACHTYGPDGLLVFERFRRLELRRRTSFGACRTCPCLRVSVQRLRTSFGVAHENFLRWEAGFVKQAVKVRTQVSDAGSMIFRGDDGYRAFELSGAIVPSGTLHIVGSEAHATAIEGGFPPPL